MYEIILIQLGLGIALFCVIFNMVSMIAKVILDTCTFVNSVDESLKASHLKSEYFRVLKYHVIKNLQAMRSSIKLSLIVIMCIVSIMVFVGCKSSSDKNLQIKQKEFDEYVYNTNRQLDSMDVEMYVLNNKIDSLFGIINLKDSVHKVVMEENVSLKESNRNLNNVIKHQNQMITNLQKK
jgi:hypothetical protein